MVVMVLVGRGERKFSRKYKKEMLKSVGSFELRNRSVSAKFFNFLLEYQIRFGSFFVLNYFDFGKRQREKEGKKGEQWPGNAVAGFAGFVFESRFKKHKCDIFWDFCNLITLPPTRNVARANI